LLSPQTEEVAAVIETVKTQGNRYLPQAPLSPTATENFKSSKGDSDQLVIYVILTLLVLIAVGALIVTLSKFKKRYPTDVL